MHVVLIVQTFLFSFPSRKHRVILMVIRRDAWLKPQIRTPTIRVFYGGKLIIELPAFYELRYHARFVIF